MRGQDPREPLLPGQREFLRSLDQTATPEYRQARYNLIADGEERSGKIQALNEVVFKGLVAYHRKLAAKYDLARRRPWLPVEPDPPPPPSQ